jgi:hypothetical protein
MQRIRDRPSVVAIETRLLGDDEAGSAPAAEFDSGE